MNKIVGTFHVVVERYGTPNPKFNFDLLLFHFAQGITEPQKLLTVILKTERINFLI